MQHVTNIIITDMNKILVIAFFLGVSSSLLAQTGSVSGSVSDGEETIPGATVVILNTEFKIRTDFDGEFQFKNVPVGDYELKINSAFLEEKIVSFTVNEGETTKLGKIQLEPEKDTQNMGPVFVSRKQKDGDGKANKLQKNESTIGNVEYVGDGEQVAYNAADNLQKMPAVTVRQDQGEGRYMSVRGTPTNWNSTLINGDRLPVADEESETRTMAFDVLSSDLLEYIKVAKAITPDIEGDAIGGSVNFITKSSPDSNEVRLNIMSGYNAQSQRPIYNGNIFVGRRSKDQKFGFLLNASTYVRNYGTDNFEVVYGSNFNHGLNRLELRDYTGVRSTYSGNIALDYTFDKGHKLFFKGMGGYFTDDEWNMNTRYNYAIGAGSTIMLQHIHSKAESLLYGGELGGEFSLSEKLDLDFKLSHYSNRFGFGPVPFDRGDERNGYLVMNFEKFNVQFKDQIYLDKFGNSYLADDNGNPIDDQGNIVNDPSLELARVKLIGPDNPRGGDPWNGIQPIVGGTNQLADYEFSGAYTELNETWERDPYVASINVSFEPNNKIFFKAGGKVRSKEGYRSLSLFDWHQNFNVHSSALLLQNYPHALNDYNGGFLQELGRPYEGRFLPFMERDYIDGFIASLGDTLREEPMTAAHHEYYEFIGSTYSYSEMAQAGYVMADYQLNKKWSFIGGIRIEATQLKMEADTIYDGDDDWFLAHVYDVPGEGYQVVDINNDPYDALGYDRVLEYTVGYPVEKVQLHLNYIAPLPMLHVRYDQNKNTVWRGAITRTYRRPNFIETKPGSPVIDFTNLEFNQGNPGLKPSFSWNLDLSYEKYMPNAGLFSIGFFGKRIEDHIYRTITADIDPQLGIIYKSYQNADQAVYVGGVEVNAKKKFDSLTGVWSNFGVDVNFTYTYSEMQIPGRSFSQSLPMQPSLLFNAALVFDHQDSGVKASVSANYTGGYLMEINTSAILNASQELKLLHDNTDYDVFMRDRWIMNASASWQVNKAFQIYAEASNLLNTPFYIYRGQEFRPMQVEYYSVRATLGMKFKF